MSRLWVSVRLWIAGVGLMAWSVAATLYLVFVLMPIETAREWRAARD